MTLACYHVVTDMAKVHLADCAMWQMISAEGLHFALCQLNEPAFINWADADVENCVQEYDDIGCLSAGFTALVNLVMTLLM